MEQNWNELLRNYGPFALLPFALFVIERIAAKRAHDNQLPAKIRNRVYATAWITIFVLCGLVVFFWYISLPAPKEAMIRGKVTGLTARNMFRASGPEIANVRVFTYRDPQQADQLFWRTLSAEPLRDSSSLTFLIDDVTPTSEKTWKFPPFSIDKRYYEPSMELHFVFDLTKVELKLENDPSLEPLKGQPVVIATSTPNRSLPRLDWFGTVWAQTRPSVTTTIANLESSDPLVRLTARKQLASFGPAAVMEMDRALAARDATYRTKLGVIVAANQMTGFKAEHLGLPAWCEIWKASQTGDDTLKNQANLLLKKRSQSLNAEQCRKAGSPIRR